MDCSLFEYALFDLDKLLDYNPFGAIRQRLQQQTTKCFRLLGREKTTAVTNSILRLLYFSFFKSLSCHLSPLFFDRIDNNLLRLASQSVV